MNTIQPHFKLISGMFVTGTSVGAAWATVDILLRMGASVAGMIAAGFTIAVAIRTLRKK